MNHIRFSADDLDLFSAASHDRNPLHMSREYARRSAYGSRVVFGVLNAITALGHSKVMNPAGKVLASLECEFFDVALLGIDYGVSIVEQTPTQTTIRVSDGRRPILETILTFGSGQHQAFEESDQPARSPAEAADIQSSDLSSGQCISGRYAASPRDMRAICGRAGLQQSCITTRELSALLWASYLVGMELPGQRALFSRLLLEFHPTAHAGAPFDYQAQIQEISEAGEVAIHATLSTSGETWAKARLNAYVRQDLPPASVARMEELVGRSQELSGKVAFVTGGSRGLGAALVRALALHGCTVISNFVASLDEAQQLRDSLSQTPGAVLLEQGDIADVPWCLELQQRLSTKLKRLDFLICNASPALLPLWLEPSAAARLYQFVAKSLAMVAAPMSAFLPSLAETKGWNVLVSSTAVTQMHPYFPHYVVAKSASEALLRAATAEYRAISSLIVRPARLSTDLTNTPIGRKTAVPPELVASSILQRLRGTPCPGKVEVLERFPSG